MRIKVYKNRLTGRWVCDPSDLGFLVTTHGSQQGALIAADQNVKRQRYLKMPIDHDCRCFISAPCSHCTDCIECMEAEFS